MDPALAEWLRGDAGVRPVMTWESGGFAAHAAPGYRATLGSRAVGESAVRIAFHGVLFHRDPRDPAESLLDGYLREGHDFVRALRGDFSLAVWDGRDGSTHLAVDGFRVQPLFYHAAPGLLLFATHLTSLAACPAFTDRDLDPCAVLDLVETSRIQTPRTIYRRVSKLPEGTTLSSLHDKVRVNTYWRPDYSTPDRRRLSDLQRDVRDLFRDAVQTRLSADGAARVGAYLSGGVDSTAVLGTLTRLTGSRVSCFSIGFEEAGYNELGFAQTAARAFGADHHVHRVTPRETMDAIPAIVAAFDEPFGNASAIPAYYCARMAHETGTQILYAGDGGDEIFAGNEVYATRRVLEYYDRIPAPVRALAEPAALKAGLVVPWGLVGKARQYVLRARVPYPDRLGTYNFFRVFPKSRLFEREFLDLAGSDYEPFEAQAARYREALAITELDRQLYVDLRFLISDSDLFKVTRTAEAAGIGVRFPFLDGPLTDFAASVPASVKMRGRRLRSFFKDAHADLLPLDTRTKKKHGFGLPIAGWMRTHAELRDLTRDLVLGERTLARGILRRDGVEEIIRLHEEERTSYYGPALWNLMMLEYWLRAQEEGNRAARFGSAAC